MSSEEKISPERLFKCLDKWIYSSYKINYVIMMSLMNLKLYLALVSLIKYQKHLLIML